MAVCEELARLTPGDHEKRSALFNSGAEAVENAVKIARAYTGRQAVVVFDHAYHGRTNLTMALTAKNMPYKQGFGPFAAEVYRVPMSYPYRWPTGPDSCGPEALAARRSPRSTRRSGAENVACVVIEPIQGEGGFVVPRPASCPGSPSAAGATASCSSPTRCRPASPHRRLVRLRARGRRPRPGDHRQGHRRRPAAGRRHRPGRDHGRRAPRRPRRHVRRQPGRLRGRARRDRDDREQDLGGGRPPDRGDDAAAAARAGRNAARRSATSAAAAR